LGYLILCLDLQYISAAEYEQAEALRAEIGYLLYRLIQTIKK